MFDKVAQPGNRTVPIDPRRLGECTGAVHMKTEKDTEKVCGGIFCAVVWFYLQSYDDAMSERRDHKLLIHLHIYSGQNRIVKMSDECSQSVTPSDQVGV